MHYLLGLAALVMGAAIATRRTRPKWFIVLTGVLVAVGALLAILSYTRVTDGLGLVPNSVIGWVFVGLSIMTMLSSIFVLERRGAHGEELPPLIGDNPFDGDTDDSDDPVHGGGDRRGAAAAESAAASHSTAGSHSTAASHSTTASHSTAGATVASTGTTPAAAHDAAAASVMGAAASAGAAGAAAAGAPGYAGVGASGTEAFAEETVMNPELPADDAASHPGPSSGAQDGSEMTGQDPDISTEPLESDADAARDHGTDDQGTHRH